MVFEEMVGLRSVSCLLLGSGGGGGGGGEILWRSLSVGVYGYFCVVVVVDGEWG